MSDEQKHTFKIIVNAREKDVHDEHLTFDQVVGLAFETPPPGQNVVFTITYRNGPPENREGSMVEGQTVHLKDGMVFNVTATDKS